MSSTLRGRGPLRTYVASLALVAALVSLAAMVASCGGDGTTPPPPTVIRADETLVDGPTATPTATATPGPAGYPGPTPHQPTAAPGYPSQEATPSPATAYPGR